MGEAGVADGIRAAGAAGISGSADGNVIWSRSAGLGRRASEQ